MQKLSLIDGQEVELSLTYFDLYEMERKNPSLSEDYFKIQEKDKINELDMVRVLYIAYAAKEENPMEYEEFLKKIPYNRKTITNTYLGLLYPKN